MIKTKDLVAIKNGEMTADKLLENYPVKALVSDFIEIVAQKENVVTEKPIPLNQDEYDRVMKLFRVRGFDVAGDIVKRGRPKGVKTGVVEP